MNNVGESLNRQLVLIDHFTHWHFAHWRAHTDWLYCMGKC